MNDLEDDGEDRGEEFELPNQKDRNSDEDTEEDETNNFQFKDTPEDAHEIQDGGQMWEHNAQSRETPDRQAASQHIQIAASHQLQDDDGEEGPSCNGEDFSGDHHEERKSEREDTEIDFIQQVDTDRDRQAN